MNKLRKCAVSKIKRWGGFLQAASPLDIGLFFFSFIAPIFFLLPWDLNMAQGLFFVFGVFALLGLSFISQRQKSVDMKIIGLIILWSLFGVFIHTFRLSLKDTYAANFINFCLMSEGFMYILCACILYWLVVQYKKTFNITYPLIIINLFNLFFAITQTFGLRFIWVNNHTISGMMGTCSQLSVFSAMTLPILINANPAWGIIPIVCILLSKSYTGMGALFLATALYLGIKKQHNRLAVWSMLGIILVVVYFKAMWIKFIVRPEVWAISLGEIIRSPLIGLGFDNSLSNNMIFSKMAGGFTFRHNDYLNIARDLGLPFLGMLLYGVWKLLKRAKLNYLTVAIMVLLIASFFQTSMYFSRISAIFIILLALKQAERYEIC